MSRRGAVSPEEGSTPVKKRASRAKPRLVADNLIPAVEATESDPQIADPIADDAAPLTLEPRPTLRPARAKRLARPAVGAPASGAQAVATSSIPPVVRSPRSRRRTAIGAVLVVCIGGALVAGVVKAVTSRSHHLTSAAAAPLASAVPEAKPILADYAPPDRDQVRRAYVKVGEVYRHEGLSGVVRNTMDCFSGLDQTPSYGGLDYCIAVDAYGEALQRKLAGGQPLAADSYFNTAQPRELKAARGVVSADGDAGARVFDVRRLAAEVSQDGPAAAAVIVAANEQTASEHPAEAGTPTVTEAPPSLSSHAAARAAPVEPAPATVVAVKVAPTRQAAAKPTASRTTLARATPAKPAPIFHARTHAAPPPPVVRAHVTAKAPPPRAHLQRIATPRTPVHAPRPKLVKASVAARHPSAPLRKTAEHSRPHTEHPNLIRATVAMVRRALAPHHPANQASAAPRGGGHSRAWVRNDPDAQRPIRIAARSHPQDRRAAEPSEWVDCRHPRGASEVRMCEGPTYGGGTLDDQYQHDRGRYR